MSSQRGNILFLILLAVVLFAALSYAVTQSTRGGGNDASNEKGQARLSELLNYFTQLDGAVQRMMTTGGVKDYELNFYTPQQFVSGINNNNTNCMTNACLVFDPAGGGVSGRKLTEYTRAGITDAERITYETVPGVGTAAPDIVFKIQGIRTDICLEANKRIGINDHIYNSANNDGSTTVNVYQNPLLVGSFPASTATMTNIPAEAALAGTFCYCIYATKSLCESASGYRPVLAHILMAR